MRTVYPHWGQHWKKPLWLADTKLLRWLLEELEKIPEDVKSQAVAGRSCRKHVHWQCLGLRMHFLVQRIYQQILVNLIAKNRSSLVLKFENVANTNFSATPFYGSHDRENFRHIPFLSLYNHVWCLKRGFWLAESFPEVCFTWKHIFILIWAAPQFYAPRLREFLRFIIQS